MSRPLAPEHLSDLRRSGLTDATIESLEFEAVPPGKIKLPGVESAYRLPYFGLDGTRTDFDRWKMFPPIKTPDGHTQKYTQPKGSAPALYMPPLFSWAAVARNAKTELLVCEGEKKAASACQRGLFAGGIAGVWCYRQTLDNGERITLPLFDQFVWTDRPVLLVPDSDVWRPGKEQALLGFFSLAQELTSRGAVCSFLKLPETGAGKVGLDDWLLKAGDDWVNLWPVLERLALDDKQLHAVAALWQKWREKHATVAAIKAHDLDTLELTEAAGVFTVRCAEHSAVLTFDRLTDARGGVSAELTVTLGATEVLSAVDVGLKSDSGQTKLAGTLKRLAPAVPWKLLLQRACGLVLKRHREGEPFVDLQPAADTLTPLVVNPLIYRGHQTLIYAPGGSLKSFLALYVALLACHGRAHAGVSAVRTPVLYLDWELDAATIGARLTALRQGHPELAAAVPRYHRAEQPLHIEAARVVREVTEHRIGLLVIDSAAMACGADLHAPEAAIKLQRALRQIGCASLVLAHVSKTQTEGAERSAYGSVFFRELARNVWELQRAEDTARVILTQTKNNFGPKHAPLGFEFAFSPGAVRVEGVDPEREPAFEDKLPTAARIRNYLEKDGAVHTAEDIAGALNLKLTTIKSTLSRERGRKWSMIGGAGQASGWTVLRGEK